MNFKYYDILSHLVPGYIIYQTIVLLFDAIPEINILPSVAIAYIIGYFINTLASWLQFIYYFSWGGKPSDLLLKGKGIAKVKFYEWEEVYKLLKIESTDQNPSNDSLFNIAMRFANNSENKRISDFNASYAFSRVLLTTLLIIFILVANKHYNVIWTYAICIPLMLIVWQRAKERGYYYAKEVLSTYLNSKQIKDSD